MTDAASTIKTAIEQVIDSKIEKALRCKTETVTAIYEGKDADGKPYVTIVGETEATPVRRMSVQADVGDTVAVTIGNGYAVVDSNVSNPSASESNLTIVDTKAEAAQKTAAKAEEGARQANVRAINAINEAVAASTIAQEAQDVANATNQHFWDDGNGAHVTEVTQDEWELAHEGHNILMNSLGILLRKALNNLVSITQSAIAFYDGSGNESTDIVATFGTNGSKIGKSSNANVSTTSNSVKLSVGSYDAVTIKSEDNGGTIEIDDGSMKIWGSGSRYSNRKAMHLLTNGGAGNSSELTMRSSGAQGASEIYLYDSYCSVGCINGNSSVDIYIDTTECSIIADGDQSDPVITFGKTGTIHSAGNITSDGSITDGTGNVLADKLDSADLAERAYVTSGATLIPTGTNLNTVTTLGTYYRWGNNETATLTNCPVSIPFKMFVERTIGNDYITQTIHIYGSNSPEWRRATSDGGTSWGDWYRTAPPTTDSATANKVLATPNGSAGQPSYRSLVENDLPTDVDVETTLATIVTQTTTQSDSYPVTSATFRKYGRVAMLTIGVKPAAAVSTNTNMSVCTINTGYRPVQQAFGGSAYIMSALTSAGELSARPRTSLTANSTYNISYTYILG